MLFSYNVVKTIVSRRSASRRRDAGRVEPVVLAALLLYSDLCRQEATGSMQGMIRVIGLVCRHIHKSSSSQAASKGCFAERLTYRLRTSRARRSSSDRFNNMINCVRG